MRWRARMCEENTSVDKAEVEWGRVESMVERGE